LREKKGRVEKVNSRKISVSFSKGGTYNFKPDEIRLVK